MGLLRRRTRPAGWQNPVKGLVVVARDLKERVPLDADGTAKGQLFGSFRFLAKSWPPLATLRSHP